MKRACFLGILLTLAVGCGQTAPTPSDSSDGVDAVADDTSTSPGPMASPDATLTAAPTKTADAGAAPAPAAPAAPDAGAVGACATEDDCVLIRGVCGQWQGVDRAHEAEENARIRERAKRVRCAKRPIHPAYPICLEGRCMAKRPQWPELRTCSTPADCGAVVGTCSIWDAVAKSHRADAVARYAKINAAVPCATKAPGPAPAPVCRSSHCVPR